MIEFEVGEKVKQARPVIEEEVETVFEVEGNRLVERQNSDRFRSQSTVEWGSNGWELELKYSMGDVTAVRYFRRQLG